MPNQIKTAASDDIQDRVLKVIATTKRLPRESVTPESTFDALSIDSLDRLNILFDLESEFDIEINDEDAKRVETIAQMVAGVRELVQAKAEGRPAEVTAIDAAPGSENTQASVGSDTAATAGGMNATAGDTSATTQEPLKPLATKQTSSGE